MSNTPTKGVINVIPDPKVSGTTFGLLVASINKYLKLVQEQVNRLGQGAVSGSSTASTSPPAPNSVTIYAQGDFIRNSAPTVLGAAGSHYVVIGWICVAGGKPGTWIECHCLTGT
jgi:hypothetical protein